MFLASEGFGGEKLPRKEGEHVATEDKLGGLFTALAADDLPRARDAARKVVAHVLRFDGLIGSYLGQTATRLRQVFRFAQTTPCVLNEQVELDTQRWGGGGNPAQLGPVDWADRAKRLSGSLAKVRVALAASADPRRHGKCGAVQRFGMRAPPDARRFGQSGASFP